MFHFQVVPSLHPTPTPAGNTGGILAMFSAAFLIEKKGSNQKLQWLKTLQHIWHLTGMVEAWVGEHSTRQV